MKDLTGQKFGRLTVIEKTGKRAGNRSIIWKCRCDCGNIVEVIRDDLLNGSTKSCGCLKKEINEKIHIKHGDARNGKGKKLSRLYQIWRVMRGRCQNPNAWAFRYYGGKGIRVCDEWNNNYLTFKNWALANGYDNELCLERVDKEGDYSPENCQWETRSEISRKVNLNRWRDKKRPRF
jgi:hypothetical protein